MLYCFISYLFPRTHSALVYSKPLLTIHDRLPHLLHRLDLLERILLAEGMVHMRVESLLTLIGR
jgi:hypothetical protein